MVFPIMHPFNATISLPNILLARCISHTRKFKTAFDPSRPNIGIVKVAHDEGASDRSRPMLGVKAIKARIVPSRPDRLRFDQSNNEWE